MSRQVPTFTEVLLRAVLAGSLPVHIALERAEGHQADQILLALSADRLDLLPKHLANAGNAWARLSPSSKAMLRRLQPANDAAWRRAMSQADGLYEKQNEQRFAIRLRWAFMKGAAQMIAVCLGAMILSRIVIAIL